MNYRHIYHAGNFADVLKHAIVAAIITYLQKKDGAFRVIDTHAGLGAYDLGSEEAQKTGEWQTGIGRIAQADLSAELKTFLAPWLAAVAEINGGSLVPLKRYPGSPLLARTLFRKQDRLSAIELHPADAAKLARLFEGDHQVRVTELDGWLSLGAHLPPKEKRGLVLVDPPFEKEGEFARLVDGLDRATKRFPGGTYGLWYPLKSDADTAGFHDSLKALGRPRTLVAELWVRDLKTEKGLNGSGMIVVNPPFTLAGELKTVLPELTALLAQDKGAGFRVDMLVGE
ncbi:23S rRNA (adenine(2030)-N(6))-methyltransferase RlmJ [Pseudohoeflea suaedae]|uniref:Ribosomal RNA large subunit methyltransferase J n=1 Tax=Pseudohoeflea suaedae TaxID=877384 RepID=A0A4R5PPR1_9HYPH|nr:23S rRNA (adenine(2030)-N(6))-methyltransferase RlmJ [Pseudohoeflea suaedae]TDH38918.1 23S rRNA (adenine(2030)-N(6))-methyltransferase RlmJ [Pseudohoeflea suaedae]